MITEPTRIRAFLAVELSAPIRERLAAAARDLRGAGADVKWIDPAVIHLTLKFLGELAPERVEALKSRLAAATAGFGRFPIEVRGLGTFGRPPRVVWAGIAEGAGRLGELARIAETEAAAVGVAREDRPYSAHVTLGRVKSPKNGGKIQTAAEARADEIFGRQEVGEAVLFQSRLTPAGAIHTPLDKYPLAGI